MRYNRRARLDRSQVEDRRGRRSAGGMSGLPGLGRGGGGGFPSGVPMGGGIGGILLFIIVAIVVAKMGGIPGTGGDSSGSASSLDSCNTGADTTQQQCRILADVNSIQSFWTGDLPKQAPGVTYSDAKIVYFTGSTDTACGQATVQTGPFYCPGDGKVYLELGFFDEMLKGQLGASGGDFSDAYVVAHEYGHHVQDLLGTLRKNQSSLTGPTSPSVRIELQADCYAGIWAHNATTATDADGNVFIEDLTASDIKQAINAATAVGDDHIQHLSGGAVNQEQWTHGSSAERVRWFMTGYRNGSLASCDTFSTNHL
jgi:predicted metalloprotease